MNSVSWFVYFAQVIPSIGTAICVFGGLAMASALAAYAFPRINAAIDGDSRFQGKPLNTKWIALSVIAILCGNLMPDRSTMYAIAASQIGEQVVKSESVQGIASDAQKALQQWIKKQIEPEKK